MNTLHIFGDSFSEPTYILKQFADSDSRLEYSEKYNNGTPYKTWSELLAEKLNFQHKNYASLCGKNFDILGHGNSNSSILYNLNEVVNTFKPNDIVIVGFTSPLRFPWPVEGFDKFNVLNIYPNTSSTEILTKTERDVLDFITINRSREFYIEELFQEMKSFEMLSEVIGFKLYYWSWSSDIMEYKFDDKLDDRKWIFTQVLKKHSINYSDLIKSCGGGSIYEETNGEIVDYHMGIDAHKIHSDIFYSYINNDISSK